MVLDYKVALESSLYLILLLSLIALLWLLAWQTSISEIGLVRELFGFNSANKQPRRRSIAGRSGSKEAKTTTTTTTKQQKKRS